MTYLRALLLLGRVSNLPTVWSNCLAAWWLGGGQTLDQLPFLLAGATLLYTGGMFLNDAFDANFDRQYRKERPIPSGTIGLRAVWAWGAAWLVAGAILLFLAGDAAGKFGLGLVACIVLYDAVHKKVSFAPVLMGFCRFGLYVVAAAVGADGVTGHAMWCGTALLLYVVGLSYFARRESVEGPLRHWPAVLLAAPIVLALVLNGPGYKARALLVSAVLAFWVLKCMRHTLWAGERNIGRTVSGLLAGIVLVDWLAVAQLGGFWPGVFVGLFTLALLFQKFVPAT